MSASRTSRLVVIGCFVACACGSAAAEERHERFDRDPQWEGRNDRALEPEPRSVRQDFGYSRTAHAGGRTGEIGGLVTPAAEPSYYAARIGPATFETPLSASGTLVSVNSSRNSSLP